MLINGNVWRKKCSHKATSRRASTQAARTTGVRRRKNKKTAANAESLECRTLLTATALLEPNDVVENAVPTNISPENRFYFDSAIIGDSPSPDTDVDLYRVELIVGDRVSIDIDTPAGEFVFDSVLRVFDGAGIERAFSDDNALPGESPSPDAWIDFVAPHTGTFFVGISGFGNFGYSPFVPGSGTPGSTGSYDVFIELFDGPGEPGNEPFDPPPPFDMPGEGIIIDVFNGFIESPGSVDTFEIPVFEDGLLHVRQIADFGSSLDPFLRLLTPTGDVIATNNNDAVSLNSLIEIPVQSGNTVVIEAGGFAGSAGDYQVVVSFHSELPEIFEEPLIITDVVGNSLEDAVTLELDNTGAGFVDGDIEAPGDRDVFRIEAAQNGLLRITQTATPGSPLDTFVRVLNSEGNVIAQNDDDGVSLNSLVQFPVSNGTVLFVEAGAFGAARVRIESTSIRVTRSSTTSETRPRTHRPFRWTLWDAFSAQAISSFPVTGMSSR